MNFENLKLFQRSKVSALSCTPALGLPEIGSQQNKLGTGGSDNAPKSHANVMLRPTEICFCIECALKRVCACLQGFSQAKLAWKKKNAIPQTSKEVKAQRPDGRGDMGGRGGRGQTPNRGGGRAPMGNFLLV